MAIHGQRWLEASWRHRESHLMVSDFGGCGNTYPCDNVCIEIRPRGWNCNKPPVEICGCPTIPPCPEKYMRVCADYIDECGLHVFVWPREVLTARQGMYEAVVLVNGCDEIAKLPLRVGAHPGAHYAEGPLHTPLGDCVKCDDPFDPCADGVGSCHDCDDTTGAYVPAAR